MKQILFFLFIATYLTTIGFAQTEKQTAPASFNIVRKVEPPIFQVIEYPYFEDVNGNRAIDANEDCKIMMKIKNVGIGDGIGLNAIISAKGSTEGLTYHSKSISIIRVGQEAIVEFPIMANMNTADGVVDFTIFIDEPNGFSTDKYVVSVITKAFVTPMIEVVDYTITG